MRSNHRTAPVAWYKAVLVPGTDVGCFGTRQFSSRWRRATETCLGFSTAGYAHLCSVLRAA
eukprot:2689910-Rhodomonas_salina.3